MLHAFHSDHTQQNVAALRILTRVLICTLTFTSSKALEKVIVRGLAAWIKIFMLSTSMVPSFFSACYVQEDTIYSGILCAHDAMK